MIEKLGYALIAVGVAWFALLLWMIYESSQRPSFTLKKDIWTCTRTESRLMLVGKVMLPQSECVEYRRTP